MVGMWVEQLSRKVIAAQVRTRCTSSSRTVRNCGLRRLCGSILETFSLGYAAVLAAHLLWVWVVWPAAALRAAAFGLGLSFAL